MQYIFPSVPQSHPFCLRYIWENKTLFIAEYLVFTKENNRDCAWPLLHDVLGEKRGWARAYKTSFFSGPDT